MYTLRNGNLFRTAIVGATLALATIPAEAQISNVRIVFPDATDLATNPGAGALVSPFDNPIIRADYTVETTPEGLVSTRTNDGRWLFRRFGLWGTQVCPDGGLFCQASNSRNTFIAWPTAQGEVHAGQGMGIELTGMRLGEGPPALLNFMREIDTVVDNPPTTGQIGSVAVGLTPGTIIVPVNVVVVLPAETMPEEREFMLDYANEDVFRAYFDGRWSAELARFPSALLETVGTWSVKATPTPQDPTHRRVHVINPSTLLPRFLNALGPSPDDIFVQCGIQFRMNQFVVVEETDPVFVTRLRAPNDPICDGGFGSAFLPLIGRFGDASAPLLANPLLDTVIFTYRTEARSCTTSASGADCCLTQTPGVTRGGKAVIGLRSVLDVVAPTGQLTTAHEIGHLLGLDHVTAGCDNPATRNLMCDLATQVDPHILGCEFRDGVAQVPAPTFCQPRNDDLARASCTTARRQAAGRRDSTPPLANAGPDQVLECTGPGGAEAVLTGEASDPETGILSATWSGPGVVGGGANPGSALAPLGTSTYVLNVVNNASRTAIDQMTVTVRDTSPPSIAPPAAVAVMGCQPGGVTLDAPIVNESCTLPPQIAGAVVEANGAALGTPIPLVNRNVTLDPGTYVVEWRVNDQAGNVATVRQTLTVSACILAGESLSVANDAEIRTPSGGLAPLGNLGSGLLDLGVAAKAGAITSRGPIELRDRSLVDGSVTSGSIVTRRNQVTVNGPIRQNALVSFPPAPTITAPWPSTNSGDVTVLPNQTRTLNPGSYRSVTLMSGGTLRFGSGTYFVERLTLEPNATVTVGAATTIEVRDAWIHRSPFRNTSSQLAAATVNYRGTQAAFLEVSHRGAVVAPNATLVMGAGNQLSFSGRYFGKRIELRPRVIVETRLLEADPEVLAAAAQDVDVDAAEQADADATTELAGGVGCSFSPAGGGGRGFAWLGLALAATLAGGIRRRRAGRVA